MGGGEAAARKREEREGHTHAGRGHNLAASGGRGDTTTRSSSGSPMRLAGPGKAPAPCRCCCSGLYCCQLKRQPWLVYCEESGGQGTPGQSRQQILHNVSCQDEGMRMRASTCKSVLFVGSETLVWPFFGHQHIPRFFTSFLTWAGLPPSRGLTHPVSLCSDLHILVVVFIQVEERTAHSHSQALGAASQATVATSSAPSKLGGQHSH